ncbi:hypothetical protein D3P04_06665 [Paracoccus onubensis]|uniref:Uncharacterized protein n=2 Tax=Paracoccus onubensis TaxID=1675788 RepID=A0A418SZM4_9RHOB|nr:hypothetical protein D3P04_06665 [Paracoccus onubensis]
MWQGLSVGDYQPTKDRGCDLRYAATDPPACADKNVRGYPWRPSIFMPRWVSRLTRVLTDVRARRLQENSEGDVIAEGAKEGAHPIHEGCGNHDGGAVPYPSARCIERLSASLNARRGFGWSSNPQVAAIAFAAHRRNIDKVAA